MAGTATLRARPATVNAFGRTRCSARRKTTRSATRTGCGGSGGEEEGDLALPVQPLPVVLLEDVVVAADGEHGHSLGRRLDHGEVGAHVGAVAVEVDDHVGGDVLAAA